MKKLNIALIGYKFMGKAHSSALLECPFFFKTGIEPVRKVIVGRHEAPLKQAAADFGWEEHSTDWRAVVNRPDIDVHASQFPRGDRHRCRQGRQTHLLREALYLHS
jgi:predicted dehydrogenase